MEPYLTNPGKNWTGHQKTRWSPRESNQFWELIVGGIYAKQCKYNSKPGAQQLMGVHKVSVFHPFIFQKSGKSTIIRNLSCGPRTQKQRPYIVTSPENTYPRGKHGKIKVHRSSACDKTGLTVSNLVCLTHSWNNFHQVRSKSKRGKAILFKSLQEKENQRT